MAENAESERPELSTLDGDSPCDACGTTINLVWFTESAFWNNVVRNAPGSPYFNVDAILCVPCFVALAEKVGYRPTAWRITPEWPEHRVPPAPERTA